MDAVRTALLFPVLAVCCFSPGFLLIRRWRWTPLEKLCASVGFSLIFLYLASVGIYWSGWSWTVCSWCVSGACVAMLAIAWTDARILASNPAVRRGLYGFAFLMLWTLAILSMIRVYSGAGWSGDWLEHFQRCLYFLQRFPKATPILGNYQLPARPPMMNLIGAFFMAQTGDRFEYFQIIFSFLNLLLFLPCYLLSPAIAFHGRRRAAPLCAIFAASPVVMQNATYTWTKLLAVFYVLLGFWFFLRGWSKDDSGRVIAAFTLLAAGMLVHYSTGPFLLFTGLYYATMVFWKRRDRWREFAVAAGVSVLLLVTWLAWSAAVFGAYSTVASNTSINPSKEVAGSNSDKILGNLFDTIVPHPLRNDVTYDAMNQQSSRLGRFRDYVFLLYQTNAICGMGIPGGLVVIFLLLRHWVHLPILLRPGAQQFWFLMTVLCLPAGIAVHGERDLFGVAHVVLQPLMILGLTLLAGSFAATPRAVAGIVILGCVLDFSIGVVPQAIVESWENGGDRVVFSGPELENGHIALDAHPVLFPSAWNNWFLKHQVALGNRWTQDLSTLKGKAAPDELQQAQSAFEKIQADDVTLYQGWFSRHSGQAMFLGDWVAGRWPGGIAIPMTCVIAMFLAAMAACVREAPKRLNSQKKRGHGKKRRRRAGV